MEESVDFVILENPFEEGRVIDAAQFDGSLIDQRIHEHLRLLVGLSNDRDHVCAVLEKSAHQPATQEPGSTRDDNRLARPKAFLWKSLAP